MRSREAVIVRVYLTESRAKLEPLLRRLTQGGQLRGMTIFEGVAGVGITPSLDGAFVSIEGKPVVLEFFETKTNALALLADIERLVAPRHVVMFPITLMEP